MDRTAEFLNVVTSSAAWNERERRSLKCRSAPSPIILKAASLLSQLLSFERLVEATFEDYVGYHRYFSKDGDQMTDEERVHLSQEIALFIAGVAAEIHDLKNNISKEAAATTKHGSIVDPGLDSATEGSSSVSLKVQHKEQVVLYLSSHLARFSKHTQRMQRERDRLNINPHRLFTSSSGKILRDPERLPCVSHSAAGAASTGSKIIRGTALRSSDGGSRAIGGIDLDHEPSKLERPKVPTISASFADRYNDEIAPPAKLRDYAAVAAKHKEKLLREARTLQTQFSEDLQEAQRMEGTVSQISGLLNDFVDILQGQSGQADEIYEAGKAATEQVKQADQELLITLERSVSHQRNMVVLTCGLAVLLLLLDWITP